MSLQRVLWSSLVGSVSVIVLLIGAWGRDMTTRVTILEQAKATAEKNQAILLFEMQDLRQHFDEMKASVDKHAK